MKKILLLAVFSFLATSVSNPATAGLFFGVRGGSEKMEISAAPGASNSVDDAVNDFMFGAFLGYHYSFFRLEGEYMYHSNRKFVDDVSVDTQTVMGSVYFSPPTKTILRPYLMTGAGVALHTTEVRNYDDSNTDLAWHLGAGLELEFTENVFLEVGARYASYGEATVKINDGDDRYEMKGFNYYGGLRFEY